MTAIGSFAGLPIDDPDSLQDVTTTIPVLRARDVLVRVRAVSVNPAALVDRGILRSTVTETIDDFTAAGLREAHRAVESGRMIGEVVVHR